MENIIREIINIRWNFACQKIFCPSSYFEGMLNLRNVGCVHDYHVIKLSKYNDVKHNGSLIFGRDVASGKVRVHTRTPCSKTL